MRALEPPRPVAEEQALQWAFKFFRETSGPDLKRKKLDRQTIRRFHNTLFDTYDELRREDPKQAEELLSENVFLASRGGRVQIEFCRGLAAEMITRDEPLPRELAVLTAEFLRFPKERTSGPNHEIVQHYRNYAIVFAIVHIVHWWKIPATRNSQQKTPRPSAASIVQEALAKAINVHVGEASINKIWNDMKRD